MKYLFDTDILIFWLKGSSKIESQALLAGLDNLALSTISEAELYFGAHGSERVARNLGTLEQLVAQLEVLPFDSESARYFGRIKGALRREGRLIEDADLMIASVALAHERVLITGNLAHFERIEGLRIHAWKP